MVEYRYVIVIVDDEDPLSEINQLLSENWEPFREISMPSSGANYISYPPCCMVLMRRSC